MDTAHTPGELLRRTMRSWRSWAATAAGVWSCLIGAVGVLWATGTAGSPFGLTDPRAGEVGSYLDGLESSQTGLVAIAVGLAGALTALAVRRLPGRRWPAIPALCLGFVLILVIPDVRVIQNFAYLFFGYTGLWDGALAAMLVSMLGGLFWSLTAVAQLTRERSLPTPLREPAWTTRMTYAAAALALPYPAVRIAWALGIPLGVPGGYLQGEEPLVRVGIAALGGLAVGGAILTIGLVRPWGEFFPRWIPVLRGRRVPIWFAVVPGLWAAVVISQMGLRMALWSVGELSEVSWDTWGEGLPGLFFLPWGLTLAAAVYAYAVRRSSSADKREADPTPTRTTGHSTNRNS
jgi:hypothetical protein